MYKNNTSLNSFLLCTMYTGYVLYVLYMYIMINLRTSAPMICVTVLISIYLALLINQARDQTWVSCIAGRFFSIWATREAHNNHIVFLIPFSVYKMQKKKKKKKVPAYIFKNSFFLVFMEYSIFSMGILKLNYNKVFHWQQYL